MEKNIIAKYFDDVAERISHNVTDITGHPGDIGSNREDLFKEFIDKHLPLSQKCCLGGVVIGIDQKPSKQIDCIVINNAVPRFEENKRSIHVVESVIMAISIKSELTKRNLFDALENLASIPKITKKLIMQTSALTYDEEEYFKKIEKVIPSLFVFAYAGIKMETIKDHLNEFYKKHPGIPWNRRPSSIIVNKKYVIKYSIEGLSTANGEIIPPFTYYGFSTEKVPGYGLGEIICQLSNLGSWYSDLWVLFYYYLNESYITSNKKQI